MSDPVATLTRLLQPVFDELVESDAGVGNESADPTVRPSDRADAQINGALPLAKRLGTNPRELAQRVIDSGVLADVAEGVEVAGPGFINVTFSSEFLASELDVVRSADGLGIEPDSREMQVVVDYSAPNVAKEMHVGHLRSTAIGDSLVRMLEAHGHRVTRENHVGDWGTPFGMLIEHLLDLGETEAAEALSLGDLNSFYKDARVAFDASDEFQERSRQRVVLLQAGDPETMRLWEILVDLSAAYFNTVYRKMGVLLTDDDLAGESRYQPLMPDVIERLRAAGLVEESDGADVVFPPGFENRDGDPLPLIVQKGTGGFNYATSDLACIIDRTERIGADLILYVVDAGQSQHFQMVFAVAKMAGWLDDETDAVHVPFGIVLGTDRKRLKTRSGEPVRLVALLDEAVARAEAAVAEKNPDLEPDVRADVARSIGIGAVKYADLSTDRIKDYVFDFDRMLAFEGNTGPYLQYAHARICSIFRREGVDRASVRAASIELVEPQEPALARQILAFPTAVDAALETYSPHKLCTYVYDLATAFSSFYEHCRIKGSPEPIYSSRLALADLTARVLERSLGLLGIDAPEQM
ncbi:arginine--tRNA ligase [Ilumatobacter nonamiensis]|uniref:arginine--tRNA ligase n=1 Tax=Ilumatobacter nonamiensis TaxID=467093 RepID=UPI00058F66E5|nr:arginine--tRNA ligase [Ilumatobacter nonamiensis]